MTVPDSPSANPVFRLSSKKASVFMCSIEHFFEKCQAQRTTTLRGVTLIQTCQWTIPPPKYRDFTHENKMSHVPDRKSPTHLP
jgi:hypothetical protein